MDYQGRSATGAEVPTSAWVLVLRPRGPGRAFAKRGERSGARGEGLACVLRCPPGRGVRRGAGGGRRGHAERVATRRGRLLWCWSTATRMVPSLAGEGRGRWPQAPSPPRGYFLQHTSGKTSRRHAEDELTGIRCQGREFLQGQPPGRPGPLWGRQPPPPGPSWRTRHSPPPATVHAPDREPQEG
jgi:hypothetical protein